MDVIIKNVSVRQLQSLRVSVEHCIYSLEESIPGIKEDLKTCKDKDFYHSMLLDRQKELNDFKDILNQL